MKLTTFHLGRSFVHSVWILPLAAALLALPSAGADKFLELAEIDGNYSRLTIRTQNCVKPPKTEEDTIGCRLVPTVYDISGTDLTDYLEPVPWLDRDGKEQTVYAVKPRFKIDFANRVVVPRISVTRAE